MGERQIMHRGRSFSRTDVVPFRHAERQPHCDLRRMLVKDDQGDTCVS